MSRLPAWWPAVVVYLLTRVWVGALTVMVARHQEENLWTPAAPGYGEFTTMWDGARYRDIAEQGYPVPLPVDGQGRPTQSAWAFYPAYPVLVRVAMTVTGLGFEAVAPALSLVAGVIAVVLCYQLFRTQADRGTALGAVALIGLFPAAPVLQFGYSEAISLLGLAGSLLMLQGRRYLVAIPFVLLFCLSRPVGAAILPVIALVFVARWWWARRGREQFPRAERIELATLGAVALLATAAFPAVVGWVSGRPDGYTAVQVAWRVADRMEYFTPWLWISRYLLGGYGALALACLAALVLVLLVSPPVRALGLVMWAWCASYLLYLAAVVDPYTSVTRFLLLLFPLALAVPLAMPTGWWRRLALGGVAVLFIAGQVWWTGHLWLFSPPSDFPP